MWMWPMYGASVMIRKDSSWKESEDNLPNFEWWKRQDKNKIPFPGCLLARSRSDVFTRDLLPYRNAGYRNMMLGNGNFRPESPHRTEQRTWKDADNVSKLSPSIFLHLLPYKPPRIFFRYKLTHCFAPPFPQGQETFLLPLYAQNGFGIHPASYSISPRFF